MREIYRILSNSFNVLKDLQSIKNIESFKESNKSFNRFKLCFNMLISLIR